MLTQTVAIENHGEWALACDVQQRFMRYPDPPANTVDYSGRCRQLQQLGGDCYDFLNLGDGRLALTVGDASGKGLSAALMIANVQSSARTASLLAGVDPAAVLDVVNRQVYASSSADRYATLFYGIFDANARTLCYVNAGHNPPIVIHRDGSIEWLETGGAPVGMFPSWPYQEGTVRLQSGDVIIGYTDGVVEATHPSGEEWGFEGLRRAIAESRQQSADDLADSIFAAMDEFSQGRQTDDATVVVMRVP